MIYEHYGFLFHSGLDLYPGGKKDLLTFHFSLLICTFHLTRLRLFTFMTYICDNILKYSIAK